jgi:hypothetical protein
LKSLEAASNSFKTPKKLRLGAVLELDTIPVTKGPRGGPSFGNVTALDIDDNNSVEKEKNSASSPDDYV